MNLVYEAPCVPLRIILVNPTQDMFSMLAIKTCRGLVFGLRQTIDLILCMYVNDVDKADLLRWDVESSGLPCTHNIRITTDIPKITDADIFIFTSNFPNPNTFEIEKVGEVDYFDSLYLLLKIANNFEMPAVPDEPKEEKMIPIRKIKPPEPKPRRPIIITDGIVALDILKTFSKNLPDDIFFCPTSMSSMAKTILCDHLKVEVPDLNRVYVWAANDNVFYVDVQSPIYLPETVKKRNRCEWTMIGHADMHLLNIDFTHFNEGWMKKDFQKQIYEHSSNHPHGSIYKCAKISKALRHIWSTRSTDPPPLAEFGCNMGVISDGTCGTIQGLPYFLPIIFRGETFAINDYKKDHAHLKQELTRINKEAMSHHQKLISYCEQFLLKYVTKDVLTAEDKSSMGYTVSATASSHSDLSPNKFY